MKIADRLQISWFALITVIIAIFALTFATFAWFQQNRMVETGKASAKSGNAGIELEISSEGGNGFSPESVVDILQVNGSDRMDLMPVSTADLNTFVTNRYTDGGIAKSFAIVSNEENIYHGRVYLRAKADGENQDSYMDLYLDQTDSSGGKLVKTSDQGLLNASRLGLRMSGNGETSSTIFYLSSQSNSADDQAYNTEINGVLLGDGQVLDGSSGTVKAVNDPGISLESRSVTESADGYSLPGSSIMTLKMNTIYQVDVYFYLEGCDPDCSDAVSFDTSNLHLAFFGVVRE